MLLVDTALRRREEEGRPIRVGIVGAGFMTQGLTNQITHGTPGMQVVAISNRKPTRALDVFRYAGLENVRIAETQRALDDDIAAGRPAAEEDALLLARSEHVDVAVSYTHLTLPTSDL